MLKQLPVFHEIEDGVVVRFFSQWLMCDDNQEIKYKKINSENIKEKIFFFYLPQGTYFDYKKRDYITTIICLSGKLEIETDGGFKIINSYNKISLNSKMFQGRAHENCYILTTNI